jgi:hypothetical protein
MVAEMARSRLQAAEIARQQVKTEEEAERINRESAEAQFALGLAQRFDAVSARINDAVNDEGLPPLPDHMKIRSVGDAKIVPLYVDKSAGNGLALREDGRLFGLTVDRQGEYNLGDELRGPEFFRTALFQGQQLDHLTGVKK